MKTQTLLALICLSMLTPTLFGQTNAPADTTHAVATPPPIPEEVRKHFVMGTTLFKDAKTPDDYSQVENEFKQTTDLAPQWPDPRYDLALAEESAGNYSGAEADLKLYLQFKLPDDEARTVQDKIYVLEAKLEKKTSADTAKQAEENSPEAQTEKLIKSLDGGVWRLKQSQATQNGAFFRSGDGVGLDYIAIKGHEIKRYNYPYPYPNNTICILEWKATFSSRNFDFSDSEHNSVHTIRISDDGETITDVATFSVDNNNYVATEIYGKE